MREKVLLWKARKASLSPTASRSNLELNSLSGLFVNKILVIFNRIDSGHLVEGDQFLYPLVSFQHRKTEAYRGLSCPWNP
jgi:hypothetical protein